MKPVRFAVAALAATTVLVPLTATGAFAAPPDNDTPTGAVSLTLGQTYQEDTTQATTGTLDAKLNQECGAPFTNASVWFTYVSPDSNGFVLDVSKSDYSAGLMVFAGPPSLKTFHGCGPDGFGVRSRVGKTYYIMAFSATSQIGGNLEVSLDAAPPPPTISATLDADGTAFANGSARITGTYTCTNADAYATISGGLVQIWKRVKIAGNFNKNLDPTTCDGTAQPWTKTVTSDNGLYADGDATAGLFASACGDIKCTRFKAENLPVTLQGRGGRTIVDLARPAPSVSVTTTYRPVATWAMAAAN